MTPDNWLRFLHTFAMSDHLGDASEAVRGLAELEGLPMPPDDADLDEWVKWVDEQGIYKGVHTELLRRKDKYP